VAAILLDALGTLVELEPPAPALRSELSRRFGLELSEADCEDAIAAEIAYYRAHLDEGRDADSLDALRRRCAGALHDALPQAARGPTADLDALTDALLASLRFQAYPDAAPALAHWSRHRLRLVVVSNWDCSLHGVLDRVGLGPSLDAVLTSAEAGARKPAPAIFEQALALASVGPADTIHVGDSLEEDVAGARAAGIEPVLLRRAGGGPSVPGVRTIASLTELTTTRRRSPSGR
jgi:putative hydrolase of the HAD superfamily